ncbi:MAG: efflux RND transporter periplasmic adaptor subunit [Acidobacteriota bacterium]
MVTETGNRVEPTRPGPRRTRRYGLLGFAAVLVLICVFAAGYMPRRRRQHELVAEANGDAARSRRVNVAAVRRSAPSSDTVLPGNIDAIGEIPIYARADGYLKRRLVDIGDRVNAGQLLAEIETPELDQQIRQARAAIEQSRAAALRARAALGQAEANLRLADVSLKRWRPLVDKGVLAQQEGDQKQADFDAQQANVRAGEAAVQAAESDVQAAEANLQRLQELKGFSRVTAPFAGIITARNVDNGTLITSGGGANAKPMFNLAQIDRLRIYVNVPQAYAPMVRPGEPAGVMLQELPGKVFRGEVTRTANSLDERTRTLLTEVQVPNARHELLPGMYAQVRLAATRAEPPLVIPADSLMVKSDGSYVVTVPETGAAHYTKVTLGRDYGPIVEVLSGLSGEERVIVNPTDDIKEGEVVTATLR